MFRKPFKRRPCGRKPCFGRSLRRKWRNSAASSALPSRRVVQPRRYGGRCAADRVLAQSLCRSCAIRSPPRNTNGAWPQGVAKPRGAAPRRASPAVKVSWEDATAYAAWLSRETGAAYRLPTDEEWMAAAGSRMPENAVIAGSAKNPAARWLAEYEAEANRDPAEFEPKPPGTFGVNEYGVADLAGNVWEWTDSCFIRATVLADGQSFEQPPSIAACACSKASIAPTCRTSCATPGAVPARPASRQPTSASGLCLAVATRFVPVPLRTVSFA